MLSIQVIHSRLEVAESLHNEREKCAYFYLRDTKRVCVLLQLRVKSGLGFAFDS